jgi:hypothetical protein
MRRVTADHHVVKLASTQCALVPWVMTIWGTLRDNLNPRHNIAVPALLAHGG